LNTSAWEIRSFKNLVEPEKLAPMITFVRDVKAKALALVEPICVPFINKAVLPVL
jgi:hypothetical protein